MSQIAGLFKALLVTRVVGCAFILWIAWAIWYAEAGNFSDGALSGTYQDTRKVIKFVLNPDHTFRSDEEGSTSVHGIWHTFGEGHIAFSPNFQAVMRGAEASGDGTVYGQVENNFGLVSITIATQPNGTASNALKFRRRLFH